MKNICQKNIENKKKPLRIQFLLNCSYNVIREGEILEVVYSTHRSRNSRIFESTSINELFTEKINEIIEQSANFSNGPNGGSGLILAGIQSLILYIDFYNPINGSKWVELPDFIKSKKAIINPKNPIIDGKEVESDEQCFKWAVTIGSIWVKGKKNMERVNTKLIKESEKFDWKNVSFPVKVGKDIINFEKNNPEYSISVISFDEDEEIFVPLKVVKDDQNTKIIDLLLYKNHYSFITSLSRLLGKGFTKKKVKKYICRNCFIHSS